MSHYNQPQKRKAEFFKPPNTLKSKVGSGGLSEAVLDRAQAIIEHNTVDFMPLAEADLALLLKGIESAKTARPRNKEESEQIIGQMLYPLMQLKANGGMFRYPLVTAIADEGVQFLEAIETADADAIEVAFAFYTTVRAVVLGKVDGDGGAHGEQLKNELAAACMRYFERKPKAE